MNKIFLILFSFWSFFLSFFFGIFFLFLWRSPICTTFDSCDVIKIRQMRGEWKRKPLKKRWIITHFYDVTRIKSGTDWAPSFFLCYVSLSPSLSPLSLSLFLSQYSYLSIFIFYNLKERWIYCGTKS